MHRLQTKLFVVVVLLGGFEMTRAYSQSQTPAPDVMAKMMELANPGENHKMLAELVGTWDCKIKFWMAPGAPPTESTGVATRKPAMGGRYFIMDTTSKMQMPGADGKMQTMDFKGMSIDAYDNVKQKFVSSWIDNMGTGILMSEGTFDPASKVFTYSLELEELPGVKKKVRETIKMIDKDHHLFEWFEESNGQEAKTMEITYTRQK